MSDPPNHLSFFSREFEIMKNCDIFRIFFTKKRNIAYGCACFFDVGTDNKRTIFARRGCGVQVKRESGSISFSNFEAKVWQVT